MLETERNTNDYTWSHGGSKRLKIVTKLGGENIKTLRNGSMKETSTGKSVTRQSSR